MIWGGGGEVQAAKLATNILAEKRYNKAVRFCIFVKSLSCLEGYDYCLGPRYGFSDGPEKLSSTIF